MSLKVNGNGTDQQITYDFLSVLLLLHSDYFPMLLISPTPTVLSTSFRVIHWIWTRSLMWVHRLPRSS